MMKAYWTCAVLLACLRSLSTAASFSPKNILIRSQVSQERNVRIIGSDNRFEGSSQLQAAHNGIEARGGALDSRLKAKIPNYLTYIRCIAIPALAFLFYKNLNVATGSLFAFASFTDWLDGYLARKWEVSSAFGAFLDPVADKLMVSTALCLLTGRYGRIMAIPTSIILAREIAVSALREWMAQRGLRDSVKVGFQGKVKTAATMVALTLLLFVPSDTSLNLAKLYDPGVAMLYLCSVVTITSGLVYFRAAAPVLFEE